MDIDDLRNEWTTRNSRLEAALRLNAQLLRQTWCEQHRIGYGQSWSGVLEVLAAVLALFLLGLFAFHHVGDWRFFVPAVAVHVWTLVVLVVGIAQRAALRRVDYGRPLMELQRELATLRRKRITTFKWALLTGQVVWWTPFMIVVAKGVFGIDLFAGSAFMPAFMAVNLLASLAIIPVAVWLAARYGNAIESVGMLRRIVDSLAGSDMQQADAFLERLARFEEQAAAA